MSAVDDQGATHRAQPSHEPERRIEVVVSRYRESLRWTRNLPPEVDVTIYNKGEAISDAEMRGTLVSLPNVGHEAHTYLHHILSRWDTLAPLTFFVQGHPFDHAHDFHRVVHQSTQENPQEIDFRWLGFIIDSDDPRGRRLFVPWSKNTNGRELQLDAFFATLFDEPCPAMVQFYPGGQFAVTRETIRGRPLSFYRRALELSCSFPDAAHCFERTWDRVFARRGVDPRILDGALCAYLKPIRRLLNAPGSPAASPRARA